jgi:hypothetical protein
MGRGNAEARRVGYIARRTLARKYPRRGQWALRRGHSGLRWRSAAFLSHAALMAATATGVCQRAIIVSIYDIVPCAARLPGWSRAHGGPDSFLGSVRCRTGHPVPAPTRMITVRWLRGTKTKAPRLPKLEASCRRGAWLSQSARGAPVVTEKGSSPRTRIGHCATLLHSGDFYTKDGADSLDHHPQRAAYHAQPRRERWQPRHTRYRPVHRVRQLTVVGLNRHRTERSGLA